VIFLSIFTPFSKQFETLKGLWLKQRSIGLLRKKSHFFSSMQDMFIDKFLFADTTFVLVRKNVYSRCSLQTEKKMFWNIKTRLQALVLYSSGHNVWKYHDSKVVFKILVLWK